MAKSVWPSVLLAKGQPDFRWKLEVEFSSQPGFKYDFTNRDFGEEGNPVLELAMLSPSTSHKAASSALFPGTAQSLPPALARAALYGADASKG